ncbi:MAG: iron-sulfur cluster-binding protein [Desulfobacteraceae bacterium]|nr:iron-sulfur cluster-binding protein [Desulfobacteraceae bacterium]
MTHNPENYRQGARRAISNPTLQASIANLQERLGKGTAEAYQRLKEGPALRLKAHEMRMSAIDNLDGLLRQLAGKVRENGGSVYFAKDAAAAVNYCLEVAEKNGVRRVVKGKSMITEEINLNPALESAGIETVETDLGEYLVQMAGEPPSHMIAPAIHKIRRDIGRLFTEKLGVTYTENPSELTRIARRALRDKFISADMGITGCNLACAETGHAVLVSNEGNIRMTTTLPRVHVAIMGMERIVANLFDLDIMIRLLCRGAAAQKISTYVSHIGGPRAPGQLDGPDAFHLVVLDNGRTKILGDTTFREILGCIRCAGCLNVCPVYRKIGGHAYGAAYVGPVGAVVTPLLTGINNGRHLCRGETLCGACKAACPVDLDIPRMLVALREKLAYGDEHWQVKPDGMAERAAMGIWSFLVTHPPLYDAAFRTCAHIQRLLPMEGNMIRRLPPPFNTWTRKRDMMPLADISFTRKIRNP